MKSVQLLCLILLSYSGGFRGGSRACADPEGGTGGPDPPGI